MLKFALAQVKKNANREAFSFQKEVDVSELETMNNDIREINKVDVEGEYSIQGSDIIFSFRIKGNMILPCARTLVDVPYPIDIWATEVFSEEVYADSSQDPDDDEIHAIDGEVIDLLPYIKENILLATPYRVYAKEANSGDSLVPEKGKGWEFVSEPKVEDKIDPRLQKLESFFKDKKKD